ncbi:MAG TPA: GNAT family N-acetyltransferase, partial [Thermohalobaculum sp.]|nr:GNAT family N-acetyltransferase [Thermohalobaculum sp.]
MSEETTIKVSVAEAVAAVPAAAWDRAAGADAAAGGRAADPFLTHRFLLALEESGSVAAGTGWAPQHLVARQGGAVLGVMPLYLKGHSQGEYVFDHGWAHAWERAGGEYYPKLQSAVPFTPVTGRRLLVPPDGPLARETVETALLSAASELTRRNGLSSFHATFCTRGEWELGRDLGLLQRTDQQFHWQDRGYGDFEGFLGALSSRKRKQLRKERARAVEAGIRIHWLTGAALEPAHWEAFWTFYQDTGLRKWGRPYLNRRFFELLHERMADDVLLILAEREGRWVAGALNVIGRETLFGRYWGSVEDHPFLHFEVCYYQAIEFALAHGLGRVEAGAQGGHKLARGYEPVTTYSLHYIPDPGFDRAVRQFLEAERSAVAEETAALGDLTPFRKSGCRLGGPAARAPRACVQPRARPGAAFFTEEARSRGRGC